MTEGVKVAKMIRDYYYANNPEADKETYWTPYMETNHGEDGDPEVFPNMWIVDNRYCDPPARKKSFIERLFG